MEELNEFEELSELLDAKKYTRLRQRLAEENDADVAAALSDGQLSAYCTDVLSQEPPTPEHPLLHAPNVFITPHIAWASQDARQRIIDIMVRNFQAFLDGQPTNVVS